MVINSATLLCPMKSGKDNIEPPNSCRACSISAFDSKTSPEISLYESTQSLEIAAQLDLDESSLDDIMENLGSDNSNEIARQIEKIGPNFTSSIEKCQQHLQVVLGETQLHSQIVARIISMLIMSQRNEPFTQGGVKSWDAIGVAASNPAAKAALEATPLPWDGFVFASAVRALAPLLNWNNVISNFDHPYFNVRNKFSLQLLSKILIEGFQGQPFPLGLLFVTWNKNKPGQLSWLIQIVQNPEIFYVYDYNHRPVNISCLKVTPDESSRNVSQWKCLDLVEALFRLSEVSTLTTTVYNLFRPPGPITTCPDLLLLGIVQIAFTMSQMRVLTLKQLVGQLLPGHANAVSVLLYAWNFEENRQVLRQIILDAMAAYYGQNPDDQTRLTRILGIAHELKPNGLAELFNLRQYLFVIDLACLASRRDFLKLDKFLDDKLQEHGEPFASSLCQYLRRRCPGISNNALPTETFQCMFTALQSKANFLPTIATELSQLVATIRNAQMKINESRLTNAGVRTPINLPNHQQQLANALNSPSTAAPIGGSFSSGPASNTYSGISTNFSPAPISKGLGGGDGRLGVRTPINLPQQVGAGGMVNAAGGSISNAPPFSMFQHQREQLLRGGRPASGISNPFDFRPQFFGNPMSSMIHGGGVPTNTSSGVPTTRSSDYSDNLENTTFSEEVQEEANSCFQQIYSPSGRLSVHEFIIKLKGLRDSMIQRDKELLMCVVKNLFDEYKFFQDYPNRELKTTAEVYGGLIREGIISNLQFATAVRKVVEAVQSDLKKPLWSFGVVALNACRSVLFKYPKVCQMIVTNESFSRFPSLLKEYVTSGAQGALPSSQVTHRETPSWDPQQSHAQNGNIINNLSASQQVATSINTSATVPLPTAANVSNMKFAPRSLLTGGASILNVTNVDTLINATEREGTSVKQPPLAIYERVSFLCNNLSQTNLLRKTEEIKEIIGEQGDDFLQWLAQYMVMKRVTVEQNFQPLYNNFLVSIGEEKLDEYVEKETFRNVDILLRSDKRQAVANFGDRQLLKNLGNWLGVITIGRDKPILAKDLDLKFLLLEAFYKGQQELLYVVPFVVKTLLASSKSTIFGARCAWVYGIVKVLVEIHNEPDLKLNLKFEIEVLCKDLNIDLRSVEVGTYLKEASRLPKLVPIKQDGPSPIPHNHLRLGNSSLLPLSDDSATAFAQQQSGFGAAADVNLINNSAPSALTPSGEDLTCSGAFALQSQKQPQQGQLQDIKALASQLHQVTPSQPQAPAVFHYNDINIYSQEGLSQHLKDPSHLALFQHNPHLKVLCKTAIVHAIKELIGGITDRSINVAITATEHVCRKDFALDPDEEHMRRAAHQMMRAMTAGMAAITCREPLATTILGYLKQALYNHLGHSSATNPDQAKMVEEAAFAVTEANLEVATNFIVKSACEKAVAEVEKRLESEFSARRAARRDNRVFRPLDSNVVPMCEKLPELIRVRPGLVSDQSIKIYDDFSSKICGFKPLAPQDLMQEFAARRGPMTPINNNLGMINTNGNPTGRSGFSIFQNTQDGMRPDSTLSGGISQAVPPSGFPDRTPQQMLQHNQIIAGNENGAGATPKDDAETVFKQKVEIIFREWLQVYYTPMAQREPPHALGILIKLLQQYGVFATDEMITKFFRQCIDMCLEVTYRYLKNDHHQMNVRQKCYYTLDGFVKMTCLMVKHSDGNSQHSSKVNLLKKVLGTLTSALHIDHEQRKQDFNGMPFHRILITMFNELTAPDPILEPISWNILESFGQALFVLQPRREPGFAFHWLDIIGHRNFIGRLLSESSDTTKTGAMYTQLILCHLKFLAPFLRNVQLPKSIAYIYKGTLRVLLVILHDFPEILCEYHYVLCDVISANCVQLRNLVLSAYPREMCLPDPFTKSMEAIESLPEMSTNPKMHREMSTIIPADLRSRLDDYLATRSSVNFLSDLPGLLQVSQVAGSKYNVSVVNAIVMYVGVRAIDSIHERSELISTETIAHTAFMDIFQNLAVSLCTEGRYLLFNAIANQLRYPNSHTHYFSCTLLYLFLEANTEIIQEQITRILFERLVALRPHPWGLLITFIELIRNRRYDFWRHEFVRCAPEIERLFTSVASSCSVQQNLPNETNINHGQQLNGIAVNE